MAYQEFLTSTDEIFESRKIFDIDGTALYETEFGSLLREIITRNDIPLQKQYITTWDLRSSGIPATEVQSHYPCYTAVANGSLDVLRVSVSIEERGFSLLNVACEYAQIGIVQFLLHADSPLGTVNDRDERGWTPIMSADYSTGALAVANRAPGEALVNVLLDRAASVHDSVSFTTNISTTGEAQLAPQAEFTVLSQAITGSGYGTVKRLLEHGADVRKRLGYYSEGLGFWDDGVNIRDVTVLHMGSRCWNVDGFRELLGHGGHVGKGGVKGSSDFIYSYDSMGHLPLHWAAAGEHVGTSTFGLLVPEDDKATMAKIINGRDNKGATQLHYAWLCCCGADGNIVDYKGQSVLDRLARSSLDGEPLDLRLIDLLLDHGAPLENADENGETVLHIMARILRQVAATRMLIERGAKVDIVNNKGNTPLHEAMRGALRPRLSRDGARQERATIGDRIHAQDEVVQRLVEVDESVMDWPNREGKSPRQLREEARRGRVELEAHGHPC
ncbi:ankyrin repeat-containing domain protein [Aspergillus germanicus]